MKFSLIASSLLVLARSVAVAEEATVAANVKSPVDNIDVIPIKIDEELLNRVKALADRGLFVETFEDSVTFDGSRWFKSSHEKYASQDVTLDKYTVHTGQSMADKGLVLDTPARHYALAVKLDSPLQIDGTEGKKELVVQYEVKLQKGLTCGGAYVKLLRKNASNDFAGFSDATPFVIMFGPDKCGSSDKVHFIFQHKNRVTGQYEEKHLDSPPQTKSDRLSHLYTLVVRDDNTYDMLIDQKSVSTGSLLENFSPSVIPEKEIDDPKDEKPADWVEEARIPDPSATKPEDWDEDQPARIPDLTAVKPSDWLDNEPVLISDPSVVKPEDWDDEDDGEWVAPQIPNPKCGAVSGCGEWVPPTQANPAFKGKWKAPIIPNPAYKGEWVARKIANPEYFEDVHPARLDPIGALAVEVWTMSDGITFDNFWLGNDFKKAEEFANLTFAPKHKLELQEQEEQREKEKNEIEERAKEGSIYHQVRNMATGFVEFAKLNPVVGVAVTLMGLIFTLLAGFSMCCAKSESLPEKDEDGDEPVDDEKEVTESIIEDEVDESKKQVRQRKKAPLAN